MWICPICHTQNDSEVCSCGYDPSTDWKRHPTLTAEVPIFSKIEALYLHQNLVFSELRELVQTIAEKQDQLQKKLDALLCALNASTPATINLSVHEVETLTDSEMQPAEASNIHAEVCSTETDYKSAYIKGLIERAELHYQHKNYKKAWKWFAEAAQAGDKIGQYYAGYFCENGLHVKKNVNLAFTFYKKAAEQKMEEAIVAVARFYNRSNHTIAVREGLVVAVRSDGTVVCTNSDKIDNSWSNIEAVAVGEHHVVALDKNGEVYSYGFNSHGQCNASRWENIVAIATGTHHTVGLRTDGTVVAVGSNICGQCDVSDWDNVIHIAAAANTTAALRANGSVLTAGFSPEVALTVSTWHNISDISVGDDYIVGLKQDGTVVIAGWTLESIYAYATSTWTDVVRVTCGTNHIVGLKTNGEVVATGRSWFGQCNVSGQRWRDIVDIVAVGDCTIGINSKGELSFTGQTQEMLNLNTIVKVHR